MTNIDSSTPSIAADDADAIAVARAHQAQLLAVIVCPRCRGELDLVDPIERDGAVIVADIHCAACGTVGLIDSYRLSFLARDRDDPARLPGLVAEPQPLSLATLAHSGAWREGDGLSALGAGAQIGGLLRGRGVRLELVTHAWSGRVRVAFDDQSRELDLYSADMATTMVVFEGDEGEHVWSLSLLDGGRSGHEQVIMRSVSVYVDVHAAQPYRLIAENLGNPYPARFAEILATLPPDAVVLDLGGGDRRHPDPRVINLEYLPYRRVDLYADGLSLPLRDGAFDFILSQAVLEHVPDPPQAVAEIRRVLKPGAVVYAEFAFMQPLHAVPYHFYNISPHGAQLLFEDFDDVSIGWFGGLGETMRWFFRLVDAHNKLAPDTVGAVLGGLDQLDALMSDADLQMLASAVTVEAAAPRSPRVRRQAVQLDLQRAARRLQ